MIQTNRDIFSLLKSPYTRRILKHLHEHGKRSYSELIKEIPEAVTSSTFAYYMKGLDKFNLLYLNRRTRMYDLTHTGMEVLDHVYQLDCLPKEIRDRSIYDDSPACVRMFKHE